MQQLGDAASRTRLARQLEAHTHSRRQASRGAGEVADAADIAEALLLEGQGNQELARPAALTPCRCRYHKALPGSGHRNI